MNICRNCNANLLTKKSLHDNNIMPLSYKKMRYALKHSLKYVFTNAFSLITTKMLPKIKVNINFLYKTKQESINR